MKLRSTFLLTAMVIVFLTNINDRVSYAVNKWDVTNSVIQEVQGKVVDCEVKTSFNIESDKERDICLELLNELDYTKGKEASINITKDEFSYCIEFINGDISGYLESSFDKDHNIITIDIEKKCQENQLENITNTIDSLIQRVDNNNHIELSNKKTFKFVKAKVPNTDINQVNNKIIKLLEKHNSVNVNTININNGCSTVAYMGKNEYILNQGKKMDLNYAICKYSSGNYVVIGTPIIITSY